MHSGGSSAAPASGRRGLAAPLAAIVLACAAAAWAREEAPVKDLSAPPPSALHVIYGFEPNDPYFHANTPQVGFPGQWHLVNELAPGLDIRVAAAWARGLTGAGVLTAVVDDGLQTAHPDLAPNYNAANSWDFGQNNPDPNPVYPWDGHGVSTAGLLAARGGNGIGVTGVAPYAQIAGLRIDFDFQTEQMFIDATLYHSSGINTSIKIKSHSYGVGDDHVLTASESNAVERSASYGTIHSFAAGNEGHDVNKKDLQNQPGAIAVAALGSYGAFAYYSNYGAALFASAPSSSVPGNWITTTDRTGDYGYNDSFESDRTADPFPDTDYTTQFGGTSAVAPQMAGVLALAKQVQPNLNTRFAKHLLVRTSRRVDPNDHTLWSDGGWRPNAAGNWFNQNYGFGLIDADALTLAATQYAGVTPLQVEKTGTIPVHLPIVDDYPTGVNRSFHLDSNKPLEELLVTVDIIHTYDGDLEMYLRSPSGTTSRLLKGMEAGRGESNHLVWTYSSNVFWGENPQGTWNLNVADIWAGDSGVWNSFSVEAQMGQLVVPEPGAICLLALGGLAAIRRRRKGGWNPGPFGAATQSDEHCVGNLPGALVQGEGPSLSFSGSTWPRRNHSSAGASYVLRSSGGMTPPAFVATYLQNSDVISRFSRLTDAPQWRIDR